MPVYKHYYVIYKKLYNVNPVIEHRQFFTIVEDEEIAKDFCSKYADYEYFEEIIEV